METHRETKHMDFELNNCERDIREIQERKNAFLLLKITTKQSLREPTTTTEMSQQHRAACRLTKN